LADAANRLRSFVASGTFTLTKPTSDDLHAAVATNEAGHFRGEGDAGGPDSAVTVRLGESGVYVAPPAGVGGSNLTGIFEAGIDQIGQIAEPFHQALVYFSFAALQQFYFDGNKRTARLMSRPPGNLSSIRRWSTFTSPGTRRLCWHFWLAAQSHDRCAIS
jgi:hypothetical protein